jgi:hypothetical protein
VEALRERIVWTGASIESDQSGARAVAVGVDTGLLEERIICID